MSRVDRMIARRAEDKRRARVKYESAGPGRRRHVQLKDKLDSVKAATTSAQHRQGDGWWRMRFADLVERKRPDGTYVPRGKPVVPAFMPQHSKAPMLPRPPGMTRQMHRRLYREACKLAGVSRGSP